MEESKCEEWRGRDTHERSHISESDKAAGGFVPGPVGFKEGGVVDDEGQEHRHCPQQKGWQELGNNWALERTQQLIITDPKTSSKCSN